MISLFISIWVISGILGVGYLHHLESDIKLWDLILICFWGILSGPLVVMCFIILKVQFSDRVLIPRKHPEKKNNQIPLSNNAVPRPHKSYGVGSCPTGGTTYYHKINMIYIYHYQAHYMLDGVVEELEDSIVALPFEITDTDSYQLFKSFLCDDTQYSTVRVSSLQLLKITP